MVWAQTHVALLFRDTIEHIVIAGCALVIAVAFALPVAVWAHGHGRRSNIVTTVAGAMYTIPSLALFALLVPLVGLGWGPTMVGLVLYAQLIVIRAVFSGLDSVPNDVRDAALGMGLDRWTVLMRVDMPLALPVIVSGLRVATVTVIGITTIAATVDGGGLGSIILQGIQSNYGSEVLAGAVAVSLLAIAADATLVLLQRRCTLWQRA